MISELLAERKLPELMIMKDGSPVTAENWEKRRAELVDILAEEEYGRMPEYNGGTTWAETKCERVAGGKAKCHTVNITFPTPIGDSFTFPVNVIIPDSATAEAPKSAFVFISFGFSKYYPIEELVDNDVIVAEMFYGDVAADNKEDGFLSLMSAHYYENGKRSGDSFGKIGMWAFAASRTLDYLLSLDCVDPKHVGVIGHSRLGKTALWAGANDTRFTHVFSNDSGCSGAAITRKKVGETFPAIMRNFPYWFCENMKNISGDVETSEKTDFDQHFLVAASAPRYVYVASATEDEWADPNSEYLACCAASPAWEVLGMSGFVGNDKLPEGGDTFMSGNVGYHLRIGSHFLSRFDWVRYCEFIKK